MKDFANLCGVNPSTFTRIVQKVNKGASSTDLLIEIANNADPQSGVTLKDLAEANGYELEVVSGPKNDKLITSVENLELLTRNVVIQALLDRGAEVRLGNIRYVFSKSLSLRPDALIMTNAFDGEDSIWFVDTIWATPCIAQKGSPIINKSKVKQMAFEKFARFTFISMNKTELFRPTRFSLVVFDPEVYDIIVNEFSDTNVPTDISVILIDKLNSSIISEFLLPRFDGVTKESYFMTTAPISHDCEYLGSDPYDEYN